MLFVRTLVFNVLFLLTTATFSIAASPGLLMPFKTVVWLKQLWLRISLGLTSHVIGIGWEERGRENIPEGPVVFAAKHQSAWDPLGLSFIHPHCAFVLKRELIWLPFWGWYLLRMGMIPINRSKGIASLKKITKAAGEMVAKGRSILIFPQGTRTPPGAERPYLPGIAAIYKGANVPVVPVAINSGLFWPRRLMGKQPGIITVEYLEPIEPGLDRKTFIKLLAERTEPATARLEAEALERFPYLPRPVPKAAASQAEPVNTDAQSV
ncbi:MAG: 1-acyl-sn-glycerol-3-phosphate acyltransferase [Proteobacteria bacterium]|nr:1-acyl-sn-glycerol-3-phosphate acyltransferase [Pseudomonadota bacterium]MCK4868961.1 1-acyl-sn-glycerol-3-phosphate acyltransferase [Alphaproteobacteria bacterium]